MKKYLWIGFWNDDGNDKEWHFVSGDDEKQALKDFIHAVKSEYDIKLNPHTDIVALYQITDACDYRAKKDYKVTLK